MDRQTLHDLGGASIPGSMRREEAQQRQYDDDAKRPDFGSSTRAGRGTATGEEATGKGRFRSSSVEDLAQHDSFDEGLNRQIRRGGSWDDGSGDDEARRSPRGRDMRKAMEATTPTLIDEEDFVDGEEDQEMISLEHERIRQRAFFGADDHLRRTPGAQMYKSSLEQQSVRRTPGASQMHRSAPANVIQRNPEHGEASALGFGLTLSTPVAASSGRKPLDLSSRAP
eukprot:CAMPEP_0117055630 /NCGR_PEP_ID=MMETSP0472-20121206/38578_1 /TAXON_ID=693140 ORGANISM="Tiarina fusus, Strain LIS" /NCGR_SAMPLE_ID=MMETSP0472 /ASSEMBLY_ACC=CAM_ASM_000603 /LENGTH=225 /DNA_ID=CAMNT_0004771727 /DNA_START=69 /DNA_END=743 /DNA_ORIENTATION=-